MTTIRAIHAPADDAEGVCNVIEGIDGHYYVVMAVGSRIISGPHRSRRRALAAARDWVEEYDDLCSNLPFVRVRIEQAAARGVERLRRLAGG